MQMLYIPRPKKCGLEGQHVVLSDQIEYVRTSITVSAWCIPEYVSKTDSLTARHQAALFWVPVRWWHSWTRGVAASADQNRAKNVKCIGVNMDGVASLKS